jgi:hypothetical protein
MVLLRKVRTVLLFPGTVVTLDANQNVPRKGDPVKKLISFACLFAPAVSPLAFAETLAATPTPVYSKNMITSVKHLTRVKILESNNVTLRPGSVYDNATYFESLLDFPRPGYNYEFLDSGLGAAEPLYPMFQKGFQYSYAQLIAAGLSEKNRHIDHFSSLKTPENCQVDSMYLLRHISEYPKTEYVEERKWGAEMIVVRLEYYTRLKPDAQCGRHFANDPDPNFNALKYMKAHRKAMYLKDFPPADLARFEAKTAAIYHIQQTMKPKWPRFDLNKLSQNSLWYYPDGHMADYGIRASYPLPGLSTFSQPRHMVVEASPVAQAALPLNALITNAEFQQVLDFLNGHPTPDFDPATEPGHDTLRLSDVTPKNYYTSGLTMEPIHDAAGDVSDMSHYKLVGMAIKPFEEQMDASWDGARVIPQIRFVYQMMNPRTGKPVEQLYLHLKWDVVDRHASVETRDQQHQEFLRRVDEVTAARDHSSASYEALLGKLIADYTHARPVEQIAWSSTMTGIWVFGVLSREQSRDGSLQALRIQRAGVDVGYYSTAYDNDLFRAAAAKATGDRKKLLEQILDDVTVSTFRDPKRQDAHAMAFNRVTCAQCHQTSARDGVHFSFNDGLDRRFTAPINVTEYFFHDAEDQLKGGMQYFLKHHQ